MQRPAFIAGFTCLISLFIANFLESIQISMIFACCAFILLFACIIFIRKEKVFPFLAVVFSAVILSLSVYVSVYHFFYSSDLALEGKKCTVEGVLVEKPNLGSNNKYFYIIKPINATLNGKNVKINGKIQFSSKEKLSIEPFDNIHIDIAFSKLQDTSVFDYKSYNRAKGINLLGNLTKVNKITPSMGIKNPYYYAIKIRDYFGNVCNKYIGGQEGELIKAIVIGDKDNLDDKIDGNFKITGLSHVMAVSGMNLVFFVGFILILFDLLHIKRRITYIVCILSSIGITAVAGFSSSVLRAMIMLIILYVGMLIFKESDTLNSLGISVLILCLVNPFSAVDISLLLSVFATLGIILSSKSIALSIQGLFKVKKLNFFTATLFEGTASSMTATVFTMPIIIYTFKFLAIIGILANILAVFPVSLAFVLGAITALFSFSHWLAIIPAFLCKMCAIYLIKLTGFLASFQFSYVYADRLYVYIFSISLIIFALLRFYKMITKKLKSITFVLIALAFFSVCFTADVMVTPIHSTLEVKIIDVGQGDSIAIIKDKRAVLIDAGGSQNAFEKIESEMNKNGIVSLEAIILTHYHSDHISAAASIIAKNKPKQLILPPSYIKDNNKEKIINSANSVNSAITYANADLLVNALKDTKIEVLTKHIDKENIESDPNNSSLVIKVVGENKTYLLMGDLDSSVWRIVKCYGNYLDSDCIKVGHHGSNNAITKDLLKVVTPQFAFISVAEANKYFLPTNNTLDILREGYVKVFRTDLNGTITAFSKDNALSVLTERQAS